jgi:NitT/TauT family transport system ATP-binding protein
MHVHVKDLGVWYGDHRVLQDVNFEVQRGEFLSIVGKSGCGKSTLLNALAGFINKKGDVQIPEHVGMVFQNYSVFPWLTVRQNIAFGLDQVCGKQRESLILSHLEMVGMSNQAEKYPAQLSGGQVQRVALARALAPNPEVILMDEPFGALDLYTREKMQNWLLDIWQEHQKTVIFVTHSIEEAIFLSDRLLILGDGQVRGEVQVPFERPRAAEMKFSVKFGELERHINNFIEPK